MDTGLTWSPDSFLNFLDGGGISPLNIKEVNPNLAKFQCDCGLWSFAFQIIDVRSLPISQDWACDGCHTKWQRDLTNVMGGDNPTDLNDWRKKWLIAHGAPQQVIDLLG